jgi:hypothetical protein
LATTAGEAELTGSPEAAASNTLPFQATRCRFKQPAAVSSNPPPFQATRRRFKQPAAFACTGL